MPHCGLHVHRADKRALRLYLAAIALAPAAFVRAQTLSQLAVADDAAGRVVGLNVTNGALLGDLIPPDGTHLAAPFDCEPGPPITVGQTTHQRTLLVSDLTSRTVAAFDLDTGAHISTFIANIDAFALARMPDGTFLVACGPAGVRLYNTNGQLAQTLIAADAVAGPNNARGVLYRQDAGGGQPDILVADATLDAIYRYSTAGTRLGVFARLPQFRFIEQLSLRASGNVLAADPFAGRVFEFDGAGIQVREYAATRPRGVAELPGGDVLISSEDGIQVFDGQTALLKSTALAGYPANAPRLITSLHCSTPFVRGDMNIDGDVDFFDIEPFVLALSDPVAYDAQYPAADRECVGDINSDGTTNMSDIQPFVDLLMQP